MHGIVLAAGFATRLYPLTKHFPKGLLTIAHRPIISYLLDQALKIDQVNDWTIMTNQIGAAHFRHFKAQKKYQNIKIINNQIKHSSQRLGAIGDLALAVKTLGQNDDLLVLPSDTILSVPFTQFLDLGLKHNAFTTIVKKGQKAQIKNKLGCGILEGEKLVRFLEKPAHPPSNLRAVPIYFYPKQILNLIHAYLEAGGEGDSPGAIIPYLIKHTPCFALKLDKNVPYYDVGTLAFYQKLQHSKFPLDLDSPSEK